MSCLQSRPGLGKAPGLLCSSRVREGAFRGAKGEGPFPDKGTLQGVDWPAGPSWAAKPFLSLRAGVRPQAATSPVLGPRLLPFHSRGPCALEKGNPQMGEW